MVVLAKQVKDLYGLYIRLYIAEGSKVTSADGICQGIEGNSVILISCPGGERVEVLLEQVYTMTQLPEPERLGFSI